ncbi:MAG: insulinase family protein [Pirellulales bacterium]|nr:insulinase family protein [Pirellulales bacterium]
MKFLSHTLENGLEIVAECNGEAYSTALGFFVRTGSRDETEAVAGVSHFLEHMAFKGTATRGADDVNREFDEIGAHYNAYTSEEHTVFYAAVLPEYADRAVELLADLLRPALRVEDFETEKQVILEEIHMYEDAPPFGADDKCKAAYFGDHPLAGSVLGTAQSITRLDPEAMREYFLRRYRPGNVVLAGAGQIDFDALVAASQRVAGDWEPAPTQRAHREARPRNGFTALRKESASQQYAVAIGPGPSVQDDDRFAAKLLATILGDDSGSRLYWELIEPGLAEQASLSHSEYEDAGAMMTYLCCDPESAADNLRRVRDLLVQAETDGITAEELQQAKNKVSSRVVLSSERPRGRLFTVGNDWLGRREYRSVQDDLDTVTALTVDQVNAVCARYPLSRRTIVTIGPKANVVVGE